MFSARNLQTKQKQPLAIRRKWLFQVEAAGIEPCVNSSGKQGVDGQGGAKSGALTAGEAAGDRELAAISAAWPSLPPAVRAGVMALIRAAMSGG